MSGRGAGAAGTPATGAAAGTAGAGAEAAAAAARWEAARAPPAAAGAPPNNGMRGAAARAALNISVAQWRSGAVNPFADPPAIDGPMAAALAGVGAVPEHNPFAGRARGAGGNPFAAPAPSLLSGFVSAVSGLLRSRAAPGGAAAGGAAAGGAAAAAVGPAPSAAAAVPLPVIAHVAAVAAAPERNAGRAAAVAAAPAAGVSWWTSAMQALAPIERAQMLYGYMTKKTDYNLVDFVGGLIKSGVRHEDILRLIEYKPSPSLSLTDRNTAANDAYTGRQLMAAIVDFTIILEYYKKIYGGSPNTRRRSGVSPAVLNNAVELLFEKLTIMLHAYTLHENAKDTTATALAPAPREASLTINATNTEYANFGERSLSVDIPAILNDALEQVEERRPKLDAIVALLGRRGEINGNSLARGGFSENIVRNLDRLARGEGGGGGAGGGAGGGGGANIAVFRPLLGRGGLLDTLQKLERIPGAGRNRNAGIDGIARILAREVQTGIEILQDADLRQEEALARLSVVGDAGDVANPANVANVRLEEGTQPPVNYTSMNEGLPAATAAPNRNRNGARNPIAAQIAASGLNLGTLSFGGPVIPGTGAGAGGAGAGGAGAGAGGRKGPRANNNANAVRANARNAANALVALTKRPKNGEGASRKRRPRKTRKSKTRKQRKH